MCRRTISEEGVHLEVDATYLETKNFNLKAFFRNRAVFLELAF